MRGVRGRGVRGRDRGEGVQGCERGGGRYEGEEGVEVRNRSGRSSTAIRPSDRERG